MFKTPIAAAVAVSLTALAFAGTAQADRRHYSGGNVAAGAAVGFAAGAVVGSTLAQPRPVYVAPRPVYVAPRPVYVAPRPVYVAPQKAYYRPAPWSKAWYQYCASRYPSFNPRTGTVWSHGVQKFCK